MEQDLPLLDICLFRGLALSTKEGRQSSSASNQPKRASRSWFGWLGQTADGPAERGSSVIAGQTEGAEEEETEMRSGLSDRERERIEGLDALSSGEPGRDGNAALGICV